jgi:VanZ family protein
LLHLAAYAVLGMLFLRGFKNSRFGIDYKFIVAASILLTGLYGVSDELHQHYVPHRTTSTLDALFDFLGGILGVYAYHSLLQRYPAIRRI